MANLASVGSHAVNGVAELHSTLLKQTVLRDFDELWPEHFSNKTNGVTPRRFLALANPALAATARRGHRRRLAHRPRRSSEALEPLRRRCRLPRALARGQAANKETPRRPHRSSAAASTLDPAALFDIQVKRIHEYKRQHLNVLHIITLYDRLKTGSAASTIAPRSFIFGGKAAPGY